ncbi:MAG: hypothetical protein DWQ44_01620 [Bacteroidetes bacterium]|nr:MAG: hypothetical protein DWQ33_05350 [Bacteroidota bacterium]REK04677.1 MAG: hypothetical protein DWQ39_05510 [Bacteroidota bacterium]REK36152.1 MAG: hypothetical protein DWQ44_01620 [Bacteroidota bacterium]REK51477.1 MAG: hypothetical protein DWQ48_01215 [Bacteroidota bacterium]
MNNRILLFLEVAGIILFMVLVIRLLEFRYSDYKTGVDRQMEVFNSKKNEARFLFVGNSHTLPLVSVGDSSVHAPFIASLTFGGTDLFWMNVLMAKFVNEMPALQTIYLGLDEELLGYNQNVFRVEYSNRAFFRYTDTLYNDTWFNRLLASSNFYRANRDLKWLFSKDNLSGNQPISTQFRPVSKEECTKRAKEHSEIRFSAALIEENIRHLKNIISTAKSSGTEIVIFIPPKRKCYLENRNPSNIRLASDSILSFVSREKTHMINFNKDYLFADSLFSDPDHLSEAGAKYCLTLLLEASGKKSDSLSKHNKY